MPNIEQNPECRISNKEFRTAEVDRNQHFEIQYSLFDILRLKNIITIARWNGRAFSSLAAIGGGLPM
jgi:hypothetical protein